MQKINLQLEQAKEQSMESLRAADIEKQEGIVGARVASQASLEAQEMGMGQKRDQLDRTLASEIDRIENDRNTAMDRLKMEAQGVISSTISAFTDNDSRFNPGDPTSW